MPLEGLGTPRTCLTPVFSRKIPCYSSILIDVTWLLGIWRRAPGVSQRDLVAEERGAGAHHVLAHVALAKEAHVAPVGVQLLQEAHLDLLVSATGVARGLSEVINCI